MTPASGRPAELSGWGRTPASVATELWSPATADELASAARRAGPRGAIARGMGRCYGDAAQRAGGLVIDTTAVSSILDLDEATGEVRVLAGTSLDALLRVIVPRGWFVPVTPGTRFVTVGGMVASDVHGKNHHGDGAIGAHLVSIVLADADGERRTLTPEGSPAEFWATVGGMGLTGTIVEVALRLKRIGSARMAVDTHRLPDLDAAFAALREGATAHRYSVCWIDLVATGRSLGRSVLTQGDFAPGTGAPDDLDYRPGPMLPAPPAPNGLLNKLSVRAFNELWFRKAPRHREGELQSIPTFFHPLDMLAGWNRLYGPRGFLQWQCVVPFGTEEVLRRCIEAIAEIGVPSFFAVLKTMGPSDPAPLSFPAPGWTLALDVPAGSAALAAVLDRLDEWVVQAGGRNYLAKDSRTRPELVPAMYPRLEEWRAVRHQLDPRGVFRSDLSERLQLF
jgi:decaprenylphospho-beta-D-ribofuranose 2-oxidase